MTNFKWPLNRPAWVTLWDMDTRPLGLLTELCSGNWPIAYSSLMLCVPYIRNIVLSFGPAYKSFGKRQSGRNKPKKKTKNKRREIIFCSEHFQICRSGDLSSWDLANDDLRTGCIKPWTHRLIIFSFVWTFQYMILQVELLIQSSTLLFTVKRGGESVPINWVSREICAAAA